MTGKVAIVGMSCRFPGADNLEEFWSLLSGGSEGLTRVDGATRVEPGIVSTRGCISHPDRFDAEFFRYAPSVAARTDPQHRLLLEQTWLALAAAGYLGPQRGRCGVFASCSQNTYFLSNLIHQWHAENMRSQVELQVLNEKDHLSSNIAYRLGLDGPAVNVQCGCSSSLVAVHLACQALRASDCDVAVAGGASIKAPLNLGYWYSPEGIASPDGLCRPFDAAAQGTVPGDGVGVVVMKRLEDAAAAGDEILAIIRGSAINNDGNRKVGYSAPSVAGQREVVAAAHRRAGIQASDVTYIEAHGTGTALGDPIEVRALSTLFANDGAPACYLSSVKSRIGHLDAASGIAGLITAVLALRNRKVPGCLHFQTPNRELDLDRTRLVIPPVTMEWNPAHGSRLAGVTSLGMGGTNCHIVLGEADPAQAASPDAEPSLLCLSARSPEAGTSLVRELRQLVERDPGIQPSEIAASLGSAGVSHAWRRTLICGDRGELLELLRAEPPFETARGQGCMLMFGGQDSTRFPYFEAAYEQLPAFREEVTELCRAFDAKLGSGLLRLLMEGADFAVDAQAELHQPALFVYLSGWAHQLASEGLRPSVSLGHSFGELVAIYTAGFLTREQAVEAVALRTRLFAAAPAGKTIAASGFQMLLTKLQKEGIAFSTAAVNGNGRYLLSGASDAIHLVAARLHDEGHHSVVVSDRYAFHSPLLATAAEEFASHMAQTASPGGRWPVMSCVTLQPLTPFDLKSAQYWRSTITSPVRFDLAFPAAAQSIASIVDLSPRGSLEGLGKRLLGKDGVGPYWGSLKRQEEGEGPLRRKVKALVGKLWKAGADVATQRPEVRRHVPAAPFAGQIFWADPAKPLDVPSSAPRSFFHRLVSNPVMVHARAAGTAEKTVIVGKDSLHRQTAGYWSSLGDATRFIVFDIGTCATGMDDRLIAAGCIEASRLVLLIDAAAHRSRPATVCSDALAIIASARRTLPSLKEVVAIGPSALGRSLDVPGLCGIEGLFRVLQQEDYLVRYRTIALKGRASRHSESLARLMRIAGPDVIGQGGLSYVNEIVPVVPADSSRQPPVRDGFYLIAGDGKIGRAVLEDLIARGEKVLLLTRDTPGRPQHEHPEEVQIAAVDWSNGDSVHAAVQKAVAKWGQIEGIYHTSGITNGPTLGPVWRLTPADFEAQFHAKLDTFDVLRKVADKYEVPFLISFSSLASVLGGADFGAYSAANAALNVKVIAAATRQRVSTRFLAICWDGWKFGSEGEARVARSIAVATFSAAEGIEAVNAAIASNLVGVILASRGDLSERYETWVRSPGEISTLPHDPDNLTKEGAGSRDDPRGGLHRIWSRHLGKRASSDTGDFLELGGDSLLALHVIADIRAEFGVNLKLKWFYEGLTFARLTEFVENGCDPHA